MNFVTDTVKRALIHIDRMPKVLEDLGIVTYPDRIRLRRGLYRQHVLFGQEGHDRVVDRLTQNCPLMVARIGSVELSCLKFYLENRRTTNKTYPAKVRDQMANNAGFFPANDTSLDAFAEQFLEHLKQVDVLAVWFKKFEEVICNRHCPNAALVDFDCLEPFRFSDPWSSKLAGKKVLVVHPFAESIEKQYAEKRRVLFADPDVLPEFELKTLKTVQSIAGSKVGFVTWFDAYHHMCDQINKVDFDICIIGAGAYGLPLASYVKSLGKQAIHTGGVTQILFGIKGKRWEQLYADSTAKLFNEHWVRPLPSETPANKDNIEKGCYW